MRESNPPVQLGRLAPLPIGQWHIKRKERESNSQGSIRARPLSKRLPSPIGLPFHHQAPAAGVEPALIRLTGGCLTVWPHRKKIGRDAETAATASPCHFKSAQRELNSRLLHGKQMGYHYTMGAGCFAKLSKIRAPCESRTRIPSIRRKYLAVRRTVLVACFVSGIRGTRTLTTVVKSHVCCR